MEFAYYPLAQHAAEIGLDLDVNALIAKPDLIDYYHRVPERFEQGGRIRTYQRVTAVEPHEQGFLVTSADVSFLRQACREDPRRPPIPQPERTGFGRTDRTKPLCANRPSGRFAQGLVLVVSH